MASATPPTPNGASTTSDRRSRPIAKSIDQAMTSSRSRTRHLSLLTPLYSLLALGRSGLRPSLVRGDSPRNAPHQTPPTHPVPSNQPVRLRPYAAPKSQVLPPPNITHPKTAPRTPARLEPRQAPRVSRFQPHHAKAILKIDYNPENPAPDKEQPHDQRKIGR